MQACAFATAFVPSVELYVTRGSWEGPVVFHGTAYDLEHSGMPDEVISVHLDESGNGGGAIILVIE